MANGLSEFVREKIKKQYLYTYKPPYYSHIYVPENTKNPQKYLNA